MDRAIDEVYEVQQSVDRSKKDVLDTVDCNHNIVLRKITNLQCYVGNIVTGIEKIFGKINLSMLETVGK